MLRLEDAGLQAEDSGSALLRLDIERALRRLRLDHHHRQPGRAREPAQ